MGSVRGGLVQQRNTIAISAAAEFKAERAVLEHADFVVQATHLTRFLLARSKAGPGRNATCAEEVSSWEFVFGKPVPDRYGWETFGGALSRGRDAREPER